MKNFTAFLSLIIVLIASIYLSGCSDDDNIITNPASTLSPQTNTFGSEIAVSWFSLELDLVKQEPSLGFSPPVASRAFAYTGIALYESVVPGMPLYQSLAGQLNGLTTLPQISSGDVYYWPAVANSAMSNIVKKLFSNATASNLATIDSLEEAYNNIYRSQTDPDVYTRSVDFGKQVSDAVYNWSTSDGGHDGQFHNTDPGYVPPTGPGMWVPTLPDYAQPVQPYWGNNRPFMSENVTTNQPPAPVTYSESETSLFYTQALEVYSTGNKLTTEESNIAVFWADGNGTYTPPGHWIAITNIALNSMNSRLDKAAIAFAKTGIAVSDAFISCWKTKFNYNLVRPITYIREFISPTWTPFVETPPFPEYTSGHSSESGAAAQVLSDVFGYDFAFTDTSHPELTTIPPPSFHSFLDAANDAALSRLYGGIHYRAANERGLACGIHIGRNVSELQFLR